MISLELKLFMIGTFVVCALAVYFAAFVFPFREYTDQTKSRPRTFISNAFFREFWYFIMGPLKEKFIQWDISPNTLTWLGFIFSLLAGFAFAASKFGMAGWMVVFAATCDVYDGQLARARNISLKSGAFLDSLLDRLGEACMFFGLAWAFRTDPVWFFIVFLAFTSSSLVSYTRSRAEGLGFKGERGFFTRAERMITLSIGLGFYPLIDHFTSQGQNWLYLTIALLSFGSAHTAFTRSWAIYQDIRQTEK